MAKIMSENRTKKFWAEKKRSELRPFRLRRLFSTKKNQLISQLQRLKKQLQTAQNWLRFPKATFRCSDRITAAPITATAKNGQSGISAFRRTPL